MDEAKKQRAPSPRVPFTSRHFSPSCVNQIFALRSCACQCRFPVHHAKTARARWAKGDECRLPTYSSVHSPHGHRREALLLACGDIAEQRGFDGSVVAHTQSGWVRRRRYSPESYDSTREAHSHVQRAKRHLANARRLIMWLALLIATAMIAFKLAR
jgi:hypothetical protein